MIKIPKTKKELIDLAEKHYTDIVINELKIDSKINDALDQVRILPALEVLLKYFQENLKDIIIFEPDKLEDLYNNEIKSKYNKFLKDFRESNNYDTEGIKGKSAITKKGKKTITDIFNYKTFTTKKDAKLAYNFVQNLQINTCVYCNQNYTFTIHKKEGKTRPHLDHFLSQKEHPFFALSFYNLIPSCYICNSSLKGQKPFKPSTHIHPFTEDFNGLLQFRIDADDVKNYINPTGKDLSLTKVPNCNKILLDKAKNNNKAFLLDDRYQLHIDIVSELSKMMQMYNDSKLDELLITYDNLFKTKEELLRTLFGNYIKHKDLDKRILSKLTADILEQGGIKLS